MYSCSRSHSRVRTCTCVLFRPHAPSLARLLSLTPTPKNWVTEKMLCTHNQLLAFSFFIVSLQLERSSSLLSCMVFACSFFTSMKRSITSSKGNATNSSGYSIDAFTRLILCNYLRLLSTLFSGRFRPNAISPILCDPCFARKI